MPRRPSSTRDLYDPPLSRPPSRSSSTRKQTFDSARPPSSRSRSNSISHSSSRPRESVLEGVESAFEGLEHAAQEVVKDAKEVEKFGRTGREVVGIVGEEFPQLRETGAGRLQDQGQPKKKNGSGREDRAREGDSTDGGYGSEAEEDADETGNRPLLEKDVRSKKKSPRVVPYQSPASRLATDRRPTNERREDKPSSVPADTVELLREDMDSTQERVDNLFTLLETISSSRYQLTGATYHLQHLLVKPSPSVPMIDSSNPERERKHMKKLADEVLEAKRELLELYSEICTLAPRYTNLLPQIATEFKRKFSREFATLNSSFAKLLDFVEDRSAEEKEEEREGRRDQRMLRKFEEVEPGWDSSRRLTELKKVREESREKSFETIEIDSWTGKWMVDNPFSELDRSALTEIDLKEKQKGVNGASSSAPSTRNGSTKEDRWGFGTFFSNILHMGGDTKAGVSRHTPTPAMLEMGHRSSSTRRRTRRKSESHRSYELSHKSSTSSRASTPRNDKSDFLSEGVSDDSEEEKDVEKQRTGLIPVRKSQIDIELANTEIPYQVPSDDTSGYQETPEELREDQKSRITTEHFWTPIIVVEWLLLVVMLFYWGITRGMGYHHSLGNLQLGRIVGDDYWSDTNSSARSNSLLSSELVGDDNSTALLNSMSANGTTSTPALTRVHPTSLMVQHTSSTSSNESDWSTTIPVRASTFSTPSDTTGSPPRPTETTNAAFLSRETINDVV